MSARNDFYEVQNFSFSWIWLVITALCSSTFALMILWYEQGFLNAESMSKEELILVGVILNVVFILMYVLFSVMKLEVKIEKDAIGVKYIPFRNKYLYISNTEIKSYEISEYKPILEYGGWGFRQGISKKKKMAYNVKGRIGLKLYLKDGRNILIGTQLKEAMGNAMKKMMEEK
jgi:hypothetical protein